MATIDGNNQNNSITGTLFADIIKARRGDDTVDGGDGNDSIIGNAGDDVLFGGLGDDTLKGGRDNDWLTGGQGDDLVYGNKGNDTLVASAGNDTLNGGSETDTAVFAGNRDDYSVVQINATTVEITGLDGSVTRVINVEVFEFADLTQSFSEVLLPREPNLTLHSVTLSETVIAGAALDVGWQLNSDGDIDAASTHTRLVLATAPDLASAVNVFGGQDTGIIATGTTASFSGSLDTTGLAPGTYYIGAFADSDNTLAESNELDNAQWVEITVEEPPNLVAGITFVTATTLVEGETLGVNWGVGSTGNTTAEASVGQMVIAFEPDYAFSIEAFGVTSFGPLAPGEDAAASAALDTTGFAPGTYWIAAVADAGDALIETDETDNVSSWIQITIDSPVTDYALQGVTLLGTSDLNLGGDPGMEGARLDLRFDAANLGNAGPAVFRIETWLSSDATLSADDFQLSEVGGIGSATPFVLNYGEAQAIDLSYEIDAAFPVGDYHVISVIVPDTAPDLDDDTSNNLIVSEPVSLVGGTTYGTSGDDLFVGTEFNETFRGEAGNDTLTGDIDTDVFIGGDGLDVLDFSGLDTGIQVVSFEDTYPPAGPSPLTFEAYDPAVPTDITSAVGGAEGVEQVIGTASDDIFYITSGEVTDIQAGDGNDAVIGSFADDTLSGGAGNDSMAGLFGDDLIMTGDGFDLVFVDRDLDSGVALGHGHDVVTDFDPLMDMLFVEYDSQSETYDPFADLTQTAEGALLTMATDSSILLQGVDVSELNASNLFAVAEEVSVAF